MYKKVKLDKITTLSNYNNVTIGGKHDANKNATEERFNGEKHNINARMMKRIILQQIIMLWQLSLLRKCLSLQ